MSSASSNPCMSAYSSTGPRQIAAWPRSFSGSSPLRRIDSRTSTSSSLITVKSPASSAARRRSASVARPPRRISRNIFPAPSGHSQGGMSLKAFTSMMLPPMLHRSSRFSSHAFPARMSSSRNRTPWLSDGSVVPLLGRPLPPARSLRRRSLQLSGVVPRQLRHLVEHLDPEGIPDAVERRVAERVNAVEDAVADRGGAPARAESLAPRRCIALAPAR